MKKLTIVSEYIDESQNSTGYFWSRIIKKFNSDGWEVNVVSSRKLKSYDAFQKKTGLVRKIFKQIYNAADLLLQIVGANRGEIIFTGTNPTIFLGLMPLLKYIRRFKWVLLVHDVFPDNMAAAGLIVSRNIFYRLANKYFSWTYASADLLICIGRDMEEHLIAKTSGRASTVFIPNWAEEAEIFPLPRKELDEFGGLNWKEKTVFQFFGNIGRVQGINNILSAIALSKAKNAAFLFAGGGAAVPLLLEFIKNNPNKNIRYLGAIPLDRKNNILSMCDIALVTLARGMIGLGVPSKAYFSLAAGKPILAVVDYCSELARMVEEHPIGWHCPPENPNHLAGLIDAICQNPSDINSKAPREVFMNNYTENIVLNKMAICISALVEH